jgi:hypothetical protein
MRSHLFDNSFLEGGLLIQTSCSEAACSDAATDRETPAGRIIVPWFAYSGSPVGVEGNQSAEVAFSSREGHPALA